MPKLPGVFHTRRSLTICLFLTTLALVAASIPLFRARAATPSSGTLNPISGTSAAWAGTGTGGFAANGEDSCQEGVNCDTFTVTLSGVPADWNGKRVRFRITWLSPSDDYDLYIHKDSNTGQIVDQSGGTATTSEEVLIDPSQSGTGVYTAHVVYFAAPAGDQYSGSAAVLDAVTTPTPAPAPQASGVAPRYQIHIPQRSLIESGKGVDAGEPSIGSNPNTGKAMYQSYLTTFRVGFDDTCQTTPASNWEDKSPATSADSLDPIMYTDTRTGRTITSQLSGTTSLSSYTDNDGDLWVPSTGGSGNSGVDHQSVGGGPFHTPLPGGAGYQNAVYYCSQSVGAAFCALSVNGGATYGPSVPIYNVNQCRGLHGHVKVAPDGTAYVPNSGCNSNGILTYANQGVIVSEDNGVSWTVRTVTNSTAGDTDPSLDIDKNGRVYFGYSDGNHRAAVSVSSDKGQTWTNTFDVGAAFGINNVAFPAVVAGDAGRAAFAFLGSPVGGNGEDPSFNGDWHLYIAHTYDGGASWVTVDATPNDPVQRGPIWFGGGSPPQRNLLDFIGATLDAQGRVLVGYADGCVGGCVQTTSGHRGNSYSALATIARQNGGRSLYAQYDPAPQTLPGAPQLTVRRDGGVSHLIWNESNDGGSSISSYKIFRRSTVGNEALLTTVGGNIKRYDDPTADPNTLYYYRVSAVNGMGESCGTNETLASPSGNSCTGFRIVNDPPGDQTGSFANSDLDIVWINLSEPYFPDNSQKLVFTMKVANLCALKPNRQWRIIWFYPIGPGGAAETSFAERYYVGMNTDNQGAVTYEYGIVTNIDASPASTQTPTVIGPADSGSYSPDGTITIVLSKDKIGNPVAGDLIGSLTGRTFAGNGTTTVRTTAAIDLTSVPAADTYPLVGNAACQNFTPPTPPTPRIKPPADFDADTKTDFSVFRPSEGNWYFSNSFGSTGVRQWGTSTDILVPGDYDGDHKTDIAVWRPSEGNWYIINSLNNTGRVQGWGQAGDVPAPGDYDGDGFTDIAVFRPSEGNWYILNSNGCTASLYGWGASTDKLVPGDYDGDGKTDVAVWRPSEGNWYIIKSTGGAMVRSWGASTDKPVPGDYDGDGKVDLAVYRPAEGNWYIIQSSTNTARRQNWGAATDIPVPGDYDGDGITDVAIWRPSENNWYIVKSTGGVTLFNFGNSGDVPVPSAYLPH